MKLPWFYHTSRGQLFCNCPRSRPPFCRETSRDVLSLCCCLKMAENSMSDHLALQDGNTTTSNNKELGSSTSEQ